jgi:hypothetical protein
MRRSASASPPPPPPSPGPKGREIEFNLSSPVAKALPAFPIERLPGAWAAWARETAACAGAPVDYVALGLFAAVAAIAGAGVRAAPLPKWREPLVLWQCAVGGSGSGKSAALAATRGLIEALDPNEDDRTAPQRVVSDATLRALAGVVARNPGGTGVVLWRDELLAWLPGRGRSRAGWQEAWSAQPVVVHRGAAAARLKLAHFPVSVIGGARPAALARALKGADDGMAARFLFAWPAWPDWVPFADRTAPDDALALERLERLAAVVGTAETPRVLAMDKDALALFERFCKHWHAHTPDDESPFAEWLAKAGSQVARLAGVLELLDWSEVPRAALPSAIGRATVERAVALWHHYFKPHAEAALGLALPGPREDALARAIRWLKDTGATLVSREDIRAKALARTVDARGADAVIARLEDMGVLVRETGRRGNGRPPLRWRVVAGNPGDGGKAPQDGHPSHLCTPPTGNPGKPDDPSRFQQPPPPGFSLRAALSGGKQEDRS